ncbi:membrane integrity-associated transporter subunit PqiC [Catenovulum maritimum]|uniref:PqiC family protein n=1 Tax=Catenovulum maritimum TaxID=1513271 RepID=UPI000661283C|nr:ABC-type transport auxiliary lipoprotein family protein [Catenovulum maritimum]
MKLLKLGMLIFLLSACASQIQPSVNYYVLPKPKLAHLSPLSGMSVTVSVADYLKSKKILVVKAPHQLIYSTQHQWAESISIGVERYLTRQIDAKGQLPAICNDKKACRLEIHLEQFNGSISGNAYLSGSISLMLDNKLNNSQFFYFEGQQTEVGYSALIEQLVLLLNQLTDSIYSLE